MKNVIFRKMKNVKQFNFFITLMFIMALGIISCQKEVNQLQDIEHQYQTIYWDNKEVSSSKVDVNNPNLHAFIDVTTPEVIRYFTNDAAYYTFLNQLSEGQELIAKNESIKTDIAYAQEKNYIKEFDETGLVSKDFDAYISRKYKGEVELRARIGTLHQHYECSGSIFPTSAIPITFLSTFNDKASSYSYNRGWQTAGNITLCEHAYYQGRKVTYFGGSNGTSIGGRYNVPSWFNDLCSSFY